ncbi:DUF1097 domain-containing protein [Bradyrhizobium sp. ARR65]|uniref:DUF1097 domain-containing protein n=1 Tax=Bradyrhizobium sp. ARR65 TaxID=1040989 RepID=UPI0018DAFA03|nr:DUF1097 domain-containing protein [Bradyrhizobium sp. ARR65]
MNLPYPVAAALAAALVSAASVLAFAELPALFVWAAFIGWASYDHSGATAQAAIRSSAALVFGVAMAWLVALVVSSGVLLLAPTASTMIAAGIASFLIVIASCIKPLRIVPAAFYGFASTFAYLSLSTGAFSVAALTSFNWKNALLCVSISLLFGTGLGAMHGSLAVLLSWRNGTSRLSSPSGSAHAPVRGMQ